MRFIGSGAGRRSRRARRLRACAHRVAHGGEDALVRLPVTHGNPDPVGAESGEGIATPNDHAERSQTLAKRGAVGHVEEQEGGRGPRHDLHAWEGGEPGLLEA